MKWGWLLTAVALAAIQFVRRRKLGKLELGAGVLAVAGAVLVSGSGPTVFGLFEDTERARAAAAEVGGVFAEPVDAGFGAVREA